MERGRARPVADAGEVGGDRIDEELLDELFVIMGDGDAEGLHKACDMFLTGVPNRFAVITAALDDGRYEDAAQAAHSLRGSAGAFGARRLSALSVPLEERCREEDGVAATDLVSQMDAEFRIFRAVLRARLGR